MRWLVLGFALRVCLVGGPAYADSRWRVGAVVGGTATHVGGQDADLFADDRMVGPVVGGRAVFLALPWLSVAADVGFVRRRVGREERPLTIDRIDVPVVARLRAPLAPVTVIGSAGAGLGLASKAHFPGSEEYGASPVDVPSTDPFTEVGVGAEWARATTAFTLELRYRHSLRSMDADDPGLDFRTRTYLLVVGAEWATR